MIGLSSKRRPPAVLVAAAVVITSVLMGCRERTTTATTKPTRATTQPAARPAGVEAKPSTDPAVRKALVEGWQAFHVFDHEKAAPPFDFAAVCEATADPVLVKDLGHWLYWMQGRFKVIRVLHGRARPGQSLTIDYLIVLGAFRGEAPVSKGDRHLWVVRRGPGNRWVAVSRRHDTAGARDTLQEMMANRAKPRSPMQRLIGAVDELRPGYWFLGDRSHGIVAPTQWKSGRGTQLTWRRSVYAPQDSRRGDGGEAHLWIMDAGYPPKAHEHVDAKGSDGPKGPPAVEIATWRGRRVFLSGSAREWPNMKTDILAVLQAITQPATQPAAGAGRRKARITRHVDGDMWAYFSGKDVSGRDVRELRTIPGLRRLSVHGCRIDADVMDAIAGLDGLTYLALECTRGLDDEGLRKIGRLVRLRHLRLEYTGITDKGMPALAGLRQLTSLNLRGTGVTDEGLVHVAGLTRLKSLTLYLSDVGGTGLRHLKPLTALRELSVGPFMPAQYMAELRKSLPKVRITSSPGVRYISPGVPKRRPTTRLAAALSPGRQAVEAIEVNDAAWLKSLLAAALDANVHEGNLYLLRRAIDNRRVACVKVLLAAGADIERSGGNSPLTRVCGGIGRYADVPLQFDLDIIHALIAAGADVNSRDDGGPPLVALVGGARTTRPTGRASGPLLRGAPAMAALLAAGADPNLPNKDGKPALYYACKRGLVQTAEQLIARGAKVNFKAPYSHDGRFEGLTPLQAAASGGHNAVVKLLIARGAKVDPIDGGHRTPLWHAAAAGWGDTVDLLMAHGADINVVAGGRTPLGLATGWGVQVAELLISKGANLNPRGPGVWTPLQLAAWHDRPKMVKFLLARGAKLDVFSACCLGRLAAVKKFLASGPSLIRARTGKTTALDFARRRQRTEIGKLLVARGAKVDLLSAAWLGLVDKVAAFLDAEGKALDSLKHRETMTQAAVGGRNKVIELLLARGFKLREHPESLVYAAKHGHRATVELLLGKGADVNAREVAGALHEAATNGDIEMAKLLLARGANVDIEEDREDCDTPLFCAIAAGQTEMAKLLIASGARATADGDFIAARQYDNKASLRCLFELFVAHRKTDGGPQRALDDALAGVALSHMPEYVETLLKMGANANALGNRRRPLLWYADEHTARALLAHGTKVDFRSACALGRLGRVKAMLAANPKLANAAEPPPIDIAARHGRAAIVKLLLARGAKPSSLSLYWAVAGNHKEVVALLLDADVDLGDPQSLWFAARRGTSKEIMRLIQAHRAKHRPAPARPSTQPRDLIEKLKARVVPIGVEKHRPKGKGRFEVRMPASAPTTAPASAPATAPVGAKEADALKRVKEALAKHKRFTLHLSRSRWYIKDGKPSVSLHGLLWLDTSGRAMAIAPPAHKAACQVSHAEATKMIDLLAARRVFKRPVAPGVKAWPHGTCILKVSGHKRIVSARELLLILKGLRKQMTPAKRPRLDGLIRSVTSYPKRYESQASPAGRKLALRIFASLQPHLPKGWLLVEAREGTTTPAYWPRGYGLYMKFGPKRPKAKRFDKPTEWVGLWLMDREYLADKSIIGPEDTAKPARQIGFYRGYRVFASANAPGWPAWRKAVLAVLRQAPQTKPALPRPVLRGLGQRLAIRVKANSWEALVKKVAPTFTWDGRAGRGGGAL